jgi:hypothetical protein
MDALFLSFGEKPLAPGSIGQVGSMLTVRVRVTESTITTITRGG